MQSKVVDRPFDIRPDNGGEEQLRAVPFHNGSLLTEHEVWLTEISQGQGNLLVILMLDWPKKVN